MNKTVIALKKIPAGFTLLELVVVLAISALLLAVTVPRAGALYDDVLLSRQSHALEKDLLWLRGQARTKGLPGTFRVTDDSHYALTLGSGADAQTETRPLMSRRLRLSAGSIDQEIIFQPRGTSYTKCTLTLHAGSHHRSVIVSDFGRVRVSKEPS